ncbi:MAG: ABC transporter permease [Nitrososphaerota archaeon]|nr:ABC transporter permease [Nitrososphaerota archaeon]
MHRRIDVLGKDGLRNLFVFQTGGSLKFLTRRVINSIVVFLVVLNLDFFLPRLAPGNAAEILAAGSKVPATEVLLLEQRFGLDKPLYVQYVLYLKGIFSWPPDFGVSYGYYPDTVTHLFEVRIGWSLILLLSSLAMGIFIAYLLATLSALGRGGRLERFAMNLSVLVNSTPIFWSAMGLLWIFSVTLGIFPLFGSVNLDATGFAYYESVAWHAILPVVTLAISIFGESYLLLRGSSQETLKSDFVFAAKSRGLSKGRVAMRYVLRNSMLPLVSVMSFSLASLVSRLILVEAVFGYPGIGDLIIDAVKLHDYPVIEGSLFFLTVLVIIGGLIGDVMLTRLDPRLK